LLHKGGEHIGVTSMEELLRAPEEHFSWKANLPEKVTA
jgi:hypothetical protein